MENGTHILRFLYLPNLELSFFAYLYEGVPVYSLYSIHFDHKHRTRPFLFGIDGGVKQLKKMVILAQEGLQKRNAELIDIVIKHPDIYVFGEFIDSPVITALKGGEFDDSYKLLELVEIVLLHISYF